MEDTNKARYDNIHKKTFLKNCKKTQLNID